MGEKTKKKGRKTLNENNGREGTNPTGRTSMEIGRGSDDWGLGKLLINQRNRKGKKLLKKKKKVGGTETRKKGGKSPYSLTQIGKNTSQARKTFRKRGLRDTKGSGPIL